MTVGNEPTMAQINNDLTQNALALRQLSQLLVNQLLSLTDLGTSGLVALGFTSGQASAVLNQASFMATPAQVYFGTATQASLFNFDNELSPLWDVQ